MDTKEVIELLETAKNVSLDGDTHVAVSLIEKVLKELKAPPRWYTPEQWEERTGEAWPDNWAVYWRYSGLRGWQGEKRIPVYDTWDLEFYGPLKEKYSSDIYDDMIDIVCATEAGPPPDDWRPEEVL